MSLDLATTIQHVDGLANHLKDSQDSRLLKLSEAVRAVSLSKIEHLQDKLNGASGRPFLWAKALDGLEGSAWPSEMPKDFCVLSVDGSHIDVDRHLPVACALINIGGCVLRYGSQPGAHLFNRPTLYSGDALYLTEHGSRVTEVPIEGPLLGLKRTIKEITELKSLIDETPMDLPALALVDGSLVLWPLSGRGFPPLVKEAIITLGLIPVLESLRGLAKQRTLSLAAYVSMPRSTEVVNTLRLYLCDTSSSECAAKCSNRRSPTSPCNMVNDILDRDLFQRLLQPGQRSNLFATNSSVVRENYGDQHQIYFFYLHTGDEIARVEMPRWATEETSLISLAHALILDQCRRGMGYPVAISEAHEQAVITGPERQQFRELMDASLTQHGLPVFSSEKNRSKRMASL